MNETIDMNNRENGMVVKQGIEKADVRAPGARKKKRLKLVAPLLDNYSLENIPQASKVTNMGEMSLHKPTQEEGTNWLGFNFAPIAQAHDFEMSFENITRIRNYEAIYQECKATLETPSLAPSTQQDSQSEKYSINATQVASCMPQDVANATPIPAIPLVEQGNLAAIANNIEVDATPPNLLLKQDPVTLTTTKFAISATLPTSCRQEDFVATRTPVIIPSVKQGNPSRKTNDTEMNATPPNPLLQQDYVTPTTTKCAINATLATPCMQGDLAKAKSCVGDDANPTPTLANSHLVKQGNPCGIAINTKIDATPPNPLLQQDSTITNLVLDAASPSIKYHGMKNEIIAMKNGEDGTVVKPGIKKASVQARGARTKNRIKLPAPCPTKRKRKKTASENLWGTNSAPTMHLDEKNSTVLEGGNEEEGMEAKVNQKEEDVKKQQEGKSNELDELNATKLALDTMEAQFNATKQALTIAEAKLDSMIEIERQNRKRLQALNNGTKNPTPSKEKCHSTNLLKRKELIGWAIYQECKATLETPSLAPSTQQDSQSKKYSINATQVASCMPQDVANATPIPAIPLVEQGNLAAIANNIEVDATPPNLLLKQDPVTLTTTKFAISATLPTSCRQEDFVATRTPVIIPSVKQGNPSRKTNDTEMNATPPNPLLQQDYVTPTTTKCAINATLATPCMQGDLAKAESCVGDDANPTPTLANSHLVKQGNPCGIAINTEIDATPPNPLLQQDSTITNLVLDAASPSIKYHGMKNEIIAMKNGEDGTVIKQGIKKANVQARGARTKNRIKLPAPCTKAKSCRSDDASPTPNLANSHLVKQGSPFGVAINIKIDATPPDPLLQQDSAITNLVLDAAPLSIIAMNNGENGMIIAYFFLE
ncbi:hypothetical protein SLEP1_g43527 [Rubroshorea leprosula]|uniref:Uncharacterized protein n=1 Tax=Rubroshorea leprosula TaxID=152421 RepID=A0AAV5LD83_9ROSI|nr:hypothetical protein SLEP1_g43527 [Rubroshorea leprosula]